VDVFSGVGGLTHGLILEGIDVVAGIDADASCKYAFEHNNPGAEFIHKKIEDVSAEEIRSLYPEGHIKVLVGCAPCQPYSKYTRKKTDEDKKWDLVSKFGDLILEVDPDIVSMENVSNLEKFDNGTMYGDLIEKLENAGYHVSSNPRVYCPDYGIPQHRVRLVLLASKLGKIELILPTHTPGEYKTVEMTIGHLEPIKAGQTSESDPLHRSCTLSETNLARIKASKPGGTWRDWPENLVAECHRKGSGQTYGSVYGRMRWDEPSPTMTTQFQGYGNGRFGHPEQDRAISLREGALFQTFPENYAFTAPEDSEYIRVVARHIGNAVPVDLGRVIGKSIQLHIGDYHDRTKRKIHV